MWSQIETKEVADTIGASDMRAIMRNFGEMQDFDINKIMNCLDQGNLVQISKYNGYIRRA